MKHALRRLRRRRRPSALKQAELRLPHQRTLVRRFEPLEARLLLHAGAFEESLVPPPITEPISDEAGVFASQQLAEGEFGEGEDSGPSTVAEFAQALTDQGVRFFGATWCPHCQRQKALFGETFGGPVNNLPFIEVTEGDPANSGGQVVLNAVGRGEDTTLNPTGRPVNSFPTWEFPDGTRLEGFQTMQALSASSGIPLPANVLGIDTNFVDFEIQLRPDVAPGTVENFLNYVNDGDYVNSIFHRFVSSFVIQGGGFTTPTTTFSNAAQFDNVPTDAPIQNEFNLSNTRGTIAMAKLGGDPNSATSQFFLNLNNNSANLDNQNGGFTVFAEILDLEALDAISQVSTVNAGGAFSDLPLANNELVVIEAITGSGTVSGIKFADANGNGVRDAGEAGLDGFIIYSDANGNGDLDADEISTTTSADGSYTLRLEGGQQHTIREVPVQQFAQTLPTNPDSYTVSLAIGEAVTSLDFGNQQVLAVTAVDLLEETDSGASSTDDITNFNNSEIERAPKFLITGVEAGARIRVRADGVVLADEVAADSEITVTLDGVTTLNDGPVLISVSQEINGVEGPETNLNLVIDATAPTFSGTPPTMATVGETYGFDVETDEEGQSGFTYSLTVAQTGDPVDPAIGIAINPVTGTISWTPDEADIGVHQFNIVATDAAGNIAVEPLNIGVSREDLVRIRLATTDLSGNPITEAEIGDPFLVQVLVQDLRPDAGGVFSAYHDLTFDSDLVTATNFTHGSIYGQGGVPNTLLDPPQTIDDVDDTPGLLDEIGSFSSSLAPLGASERVLSEIEFQANAGGTVEFGTNPADLTNIHELGLYNRNGAVANDQIEFGSTTLSINSNFIVLNPTFGPDEDSLPTTLPVQSLAEFRDGFSGTLTVSEVSDPGHGTVALASNGLSFSYEPDADYFGSDELTYTVTDGTSTAKGTVTIAVQPVNDPPIAVDDSFEDPTNGSDFVIVEDNQDNFLPVLSNDTSGVDDPSTESLSVNTVQTTSAQGGTVVRSSSGLGILYTPATNFRGQDTFTYSISDGLGGLSENATVTVNVIELNDPPTANDDTFPLSGDTILEDSLNIVLDVLANDSTAPDDDEVLTITAVTNLSGGGVVTVIENGTQLQYSPASDFFGQETFTYTVNDGNGGTDQANVTVNVTAVNDPPTANDDSGNAFRVTQNTSANVLDVLANDTFAPDADEVLTITAVSGVSSGTTVTIANDGLSVLYTPVTDFLGEDSFNYTIDDGSGETATATVTVNVVEFIPGSLAGFVYIDANNNGVMEAGERGLDGVTIQLTGTDLFGSVDETMVTANGGAYLFDGLAPGDYVLAETQPAENFEGDGIPIIDGIDTVGSQGGTLSANDQITLALEEGIDGVGNNFAEVKGRNLSGLFLLDPASARFAGLMVNLFDTTNGELLRQNLTAADGSYNFVGLTPDSYLVEAQPANFLFTPSGSLMATVASQDSTDNNFSGTARVAGSISYRDFIAARSPQAVHASVQPGAPAQEWYSIATGWEGVTDVVVQLADNNTSLNLRITETGGQLLEGQLPIPDPQGRVRILSRHSSGTTLIRLDGDRSAYNDVLQNVVPSGNSEGEGEVAPAGIISRPPLPSAVPTPALTTTPVGTSALQPVTVAQSTSASDTLVSPPSESRVFSGSFTSQIVASTLSSLSSTPASPPRAQAVAAAFADPEFIPFADQVDADQGHDAADGERHDEVTLLEALDEAFADNTLLETLH